MPENLQRAMAAEAEAARNARAKVDNDQLWPYAFILMMVMGDSELNIDSFQGDSSRGGAQGKQSSEAREQKSNCSLYNRLFYLCCLKIGVDP